MSISYSAYLYLIAAAAFEVLWVLCVRLSDGFSRLLPSGLAAVSMFLSVLLLAKASQQLPVALAIEAGLEWAPSAVLCCNNSIFNNRSAPAPGLVC